jgi:hypothetical protein
LNATTERPAPKYLTYATNMWRLTIPDVVVPIFPARHEFEEDGTRGSLSATPPGIDTIEIEEILLNLRTERDVEFELHSNNIEVARCQVSSTEPYAFVSRIGCRFFQYETESSATTLVDLEEADSELGAEYQQVIDDLRNGSREILARELIEMLRICQENPEETEIKLFSLQSMARFLIEQKEFEDPIAGPGPNGIMQAEWHIVGDGLLVMAFSEDNQIHCVVQTDADSQGEMLYRSVQLSEKEALEEFGYLVPLRQA